MLSYFAFRRSIKEENSKMENNAPFASRESFQRARSFDIEKFNKENKTFLWTDSLDDKKNACAAYLVVKFGLWVKFSRRFVSGTSYDDGYHEFTYSNLEVTMGKDRCELSMRFVSEDTVEYERSNEPIDEDFGKAIMEVMEEAYDRETVSKRNALIFNSWKSIHQHMHCINSCVKPFQIRMFQATIIAEEILFAPENNKRGLRMREVQNILASATSAAANFLGHKTRNTAKASYIDPRVIAQWLKRNGHRSEWVLRSESFNWAIEEIEESSEPFDFLQIGLVHSNLTLDEYISGAMEEKCVME